MRTVVLSFFLLFVVGLGLLHIVRENFDALSDSATNKTQWRRMTDKWLTHYESNKEQASKKQRSFFKLLMADVDTSRIDDLSKHPYNLSMYQIRDLYDSEIQSMQKDLDGWSPKEGFYSNSPELSAWLQTWNTWKPKFDDMFSKGQTTSPQFIFNNSVNPKYPGSNRGTQLLVQETRTMKEDMTAWSSSGQNTNPRPFMDTAPQNQVKVNTIMRAMDGRWQDATKQEWVPKGNPEPCNCANNPDYIKKDEIPCWNCTL